MFCSRFCKVLSVESEVMSGNDDSCVSSSAGSDDFKQSHNKLSFYDPFILK